MPKGIMTQGVAVLFETAPALPEVASALAAFAIQDETVPASSWAVAGPGVMLAYRPEVGGRVHVDCVDRPWPDDPPDPDAEPELAQAWGTGQFGPFAHPGALDRATRHAWAWHDAAATVARHHAFLRIRASYAVGDDTAVVTPEGYDAGAELRFVAGVAVALLTLPGALCLFNPNGEVLLPAADLADALAYADEGSEAPLEVCANVRLFRLDEGTVLMDTVGMWQLDVPDHEAAFAAGAHDPTAVDAFLRDVSKYVFANGLVVGDGDTIDGPGGVEWRAHSFARGLSQPPRPTLRWLPEDGNPLPGSLTEQPSA